MALHFVQGLLEMLLQVLQLFGHHLVVLDDSCNGQTVQTFLHSCQLVAEDAGLMVAINCESQVSNTADEQKGQSSADNAGKPLHFRDE